MFRRGMALIFAVCFTFTMCGTPAFAGPPKKAEKYRKDFETAFMIAGDDWDVRHYYAGQIHTESAWRNDAVSPAGAMGLCQAMRGTAKDWKARFPDLKPYDGPFDPMFCMIGMMEYMKQLKGFQSGQTDPIEAQAIASASYNSGWLYWRRRRAAAMLDGVDRNVYENLLAYDDATGQHEDALHENLGYWPRIRRLALEYIGW